MTFNNESQLKKFLAKKCAEAVANTEKKVYDGLANNLYQFYLEYDPEEYIRTGELLNALESTGIKRTGNQHVNRAEAEVYFNTPNYEQGVMELQHTPEHGRYGWADMSGEQVLNIAMVGSLPHGNYERGTAIWTKSMRDFGGKNGIEKMLKQELKNKGL